MKIDREEALHLSQLCAKEHGISIGPFFTGRHTSAQTYSGKLGTEFDHGSWMVYFENPKYEEQIQAQKRAGVVECPGPSKHHIFQVNDQNGVAEPFLRL